MEFQILDWGSLNEAPLVVYTVLVTVLTISNLILSQVGIDISVNPLLLYCRPLVRDLFAFFQIKVLKESFFGWICGPPGSGKSVASLAFAFGLDRKDWTVTWISLRRENSTVITRLDSRGMKSFEMDPDEIHLLKACLNEKVDTTKRTP
jgi:hypothetical protein